MIRCTRHVARKAGRDCACCALPIAAGDEYRQLIAIREDFADRPFVRALAHEDCAARDGEWWRLRSADDGYGDPTCEYVRENYGLAVRRGSRVVVEGAKHGRVVGATHHVWVRLNGARHATPWHPSDVALEAA